jgi:hypothetical protein
MNKPPKEKAREIFEEMLDKVTDFEVDCYTYCYGGTPDYKGIAKTAALYSVDLVIQANPYKFIEAGDSFSTPYSYPNSDYWQEVKSEIEKL